MKISYITPEIINEINKGIADSFLPDFEKMRQKLYEIMITATIENIVEHSIKIGIIIITFIFIKIAINRLFDDHIVT